MYSLPNRHSHSLAHVADCLARESIYQTPFFRERYEARARENLQHSLAVLS